MRATDSFKVGANSSRSNRSVWPVSETDELQSLGERAGLALTPAVLKAKNSPLHLLDDERLLRQWAYVNGRWTSADDHAQFAVTNPADGSIVGRVALLGSAEARRAVSDAHRAFSHWRRLLPQERGALLREWGRLILENREDLARLMTIEQGKPLQESRAEMSYAAEFLDWYSEEGRRINGDTITPHLSDRQMQVRRQPVGVAAAITPWNFPAAMITRKSGAALAAGCTLVVRPASETPFSALALAELADRAGIPAGVFSVLPGSHDIVAEFCTNPLVKTISFTGSTKVGTHLLEQAASTVKRVAMELGGHAPFIGFTDAGLEELVEGALTAKFQTSGQDCLAANRIYIQRGIYESFLEAFSARVRALRVGNGLDESVEIGPLMNSSAVTRCRSQVEDGVAKGARLICGGSGHPAGPLYFEPTVLADVSPDMQISYQETFGPVAAVMAFEGEDDLLASVNHASLGLASYLYTNNHKRILRLTDALEYGMIAVNCVKMTGGPIPFGGVKQSGLGREGGRWGMDDYLDYKYICSASH